MSIHDLFLITATLLCGLTAGLLFAFTVVVMPGIRTLPDREFLGAFKVMDRVIQNNEPLFLLVWAGSVVALITAGVMNFSVVAGTARLLLIGAVALYLFGVQLPTFVVNVPLNNRVQATEVDTLNATALQQARTAFEPRWVFWNAVRTVAGILTTAFLLAVSYGG